MAKLCVSPVSTDVSILICIEDLTRTDGGGLTGLVYNSSGLTAYYSRPGAASAAISLVTQTVTGAHSDGGFVEIDATYMPGVYRLDLPDAVCAAGARSAVVVLRGATNMVPSRLEIDLSSQVDVTRVAADATAGTNLKAQFDGATGLTGDKYPATQGGLATAVAALPAAVWGATTRTLTSLSALLASIAAAVWSYSSRVLTQAPADTGSVNADDDVIVYRRANNTFAISGLGSIAARTALYVTVKRSPAEPDASAVILCEETAGLTVVAGSAYANPTHMTITVSDPVAGDLDCVIDHEAASLLPYGDDLHYEVKAIYAGGPGLPLCGGRFTVLEPLVRAVA